jgi:hypothetical protein
MHPRTLQAARCSFSPVAALQETDGENFVACALEVGPGHLPFDQVECSCVNLTAQVACCRVTSSSLLMHPQLAASLYGQEHQVLRVAALTTPEPVPAARQLHGHDCQHWRQAPLLLACQLMVNTLQSALKQGQQLSGGVLQGVLSTCRCLTSLSSWTLYLCSVCA